VWQALAEMARRRCAGRYVPRTVRARRQAMFYHKKKGAVFVRGDVGGVGEWCVAEVGPAWRGRGECPQVATFCTAKVAEMFAAVNAAFIYGGERAFQQAVNQAFKTRQQWWILATQVSVNNKASIEYPCPFFAINQVNRCG